MEQKQMTVAFTKIIELTQALGVRSIKDLPGCWTHAVDEHWHIAVNGHPEPVEAQPTATDMSIPVEPYDCAVWYNGWFAGAFNPYGGILAAGSAANEDAFIAALERAIARDRAAHTTPVEVLP